MKKVGILTYQRAHNYGAVLQAYALRTYLKKKNLDVDMVDYWPLYRKGIYDLLHLNFKEKSILSNAKAMVAFLIVFIRKYTRYSRFNNFINNAYTERLDEPVSTEFDNAFRLLESTFKLTHGI